MSLVLLRIAGPLQSWAGYRHQVNMTSSVPTAALPRKSGITGLVGASLGPSDRGFGSARDLPALGSRFRLHVRVEARNPVAEDFQVLAPLPARAALRADVLGRLGTASTKEFRNNRRADGNFPTTVSRRDYLAHSEFIVALEAEEETARAWFEALSAPVFMPYFGRRSCAPTFPFALGVHPGTVDEVFSALPHVDKYGASGGKPELAGYQISGDYDSHHELAHPHPYSPLTTAQRADQLSWVKEHLSR